MGVGTDAATTPSLSVPAIIEALLRGELSEAQARRLHALGPEAVRLAALAATRRIAEQDRRIEELQGKLRAAGTPGPGTPSGMVPLYAKTAADKTRRGTPGARNGHQGHRRPAPAKIDRRHTHAPLKRCPCCHGPVRPSSKSRTRVIEDIPEDIQPVVTEHTIPQHWCAKCHTYVEPVVDEALPGATIGHNLVALTSWLHYGLGVTIDQTIQILSSHLHTRLSPGGLVDMWRRTAQALTPWYQQIAKEALASAVLHADETGWRVDGDTWWLWCFCNRRCVYYMIDRCRGSPALEMFFTESFKGTLVHDFWAAYESVWVDEHQCCLVHLLRELEKVDEHNGSEAWRAFAKKLRRLLRDGIRLRKRADFHPGTHGRRIALIDRRLIEMAEASYTDPDAARLGKRLSRHRDNLFTFLDHPGVPFDNNFAERQIRPAVILRKNSQCNRSERGAATQAVLMSVYRTLRLRGLDPIRTIAHALAALLSTGTLPPLPESGAADG